MATTISARLFSYLLPVFLDWVDVADIRQTFYNVNNLYDLFTNAAGDTILKYLKEIDLYTKI